MISTHAHSQYLISLSIATVAAVDVYMEVLVGILGDDATTWLTNWIQEEYEFQNTEIELDECQLDALRLLGGRVEATCGKCNSTSLVGLLPDKCEYTVESLDSIWDNTDRKSRTLFSTFYCPRSKQLHLYNNIGLRTSYRLVSERGKIPEARMLWK